jgi:hypothetical protein
MKVSRIWDDFLIRNTVCMKAEGRKKEFGFKQAAPSRSWRGQHDMEKLHYLAV